MKNGKGHIWLFDEYDEAPWELTWEICALGQSKSDRKCLQPIKKGNARKGLFSGV